MWSIDTQNLHKSRVEITKSNKKKSEVVVASFEIMRQTYSPKKDVLAVLQLRKSALKGCRTQKQNFINYNLFI